MPIRSSGQISFSEIQTEFTGTNPISLSEYYRLGAYVPSLPVNSNLPTAGATAQRGLFQDHRLLQALI